MTEPGERIDALALFAAGAHEVKNDLMRLTSHLDRLEARLGVQEEVRAVRGLTQRISVDLSQILAGFRLQQTGVAVNLETTWAADVFTEAAARHADFLASAGIHLEQHCDEELTFVADEYLVRLILDTLIHNAVDAGATHLRLSAEPGEASVVIALDDNGPGFSDDLLTDGVSYGSGLGGLGLRLARRFMALHSAPSQSGQLILERSGRLGGARVRLVFPG